MKEKIYVIDTSAILSGIPLDFKDSEVIAPNGIKDEIKPGGRDHQNFIFQIEKGLKILSPTKKSMDKIEEISEGLGEKNRLSKIDKEILALAYDYCKKKDKQVIILTDDYSIQNVAIFLKIKYENISQKGIIKKFKWVYRCSGCGKKFKENINICPICGSKTRSVVSDKKDI